LIAEVEFRKFQSDVNGVVGAGQGQYAAIGYSYDEKEINSEGPQEMIGGDLTKSCSEDEPPYVKPIGLSISDEIVLVSYESYV
jgi:hypothetical protein